MSIELAPQLCPVCDTAYDSKEELMEINKTTYRHTSAVEKCITDGQLVQERIPIWVCAQYGARWHEPVRCLQCNQNYDRHKMEFSA